MLAATSITCAVASVTRAIAHPQCAPDSGLSVMRIACSATLGESRLCRCRSGELHGKARGLSVTEPSPSGLGARLARLTGEPTGVSRPTPDRRLTMSAMVALSRSATSIGSGTSIREEKSVLPPSVVPSTGRETRRRRQVPKAFLFHAKNVVSRLRAARTQATPTTAQTTL